MVTKWPCINMIIHHLLPTDQKVAVNSRIWIHADITVVVIKSQRLFCLLISHQPGYERSESTSLPRVAPTLENAHMSPFFPGTSTYKQPSLWKRSQDTQPMRPISLRLVKKSFFQPSELQPHSRLLRVEMLTPFENLPLFPFLPSFLTSVLTTLNLHISRTERLEKSRTQEREKTMDPEAGC